MRRSQNEMEADNLRNGFDYDLQVWVKDYIIQPLQVAVSKGIAGKDIRTVKQLN